MIKGNKKAFILLGIATIFTLVASGVYSVIFVYIKNKLEATSVLSEKIEELSGKESRINASMTTLKRASGDIEKLSSYFFKENEVVSFTKKIENLGVQSGTSLTIESLDPGSSDKNVPVINIRIKATGKFESVMRLLVLLENFPGKFEWKSVRLSTEGPSQEIDSKDGKQIKVAPPLPTWRVEVSLVALNFVNK